MERRRGDEGGDADDADDDEGNVDYYALNGDDDRRNDYVTESKTAFETVV